MFKKRKIEKYPTHVAFIMDGNRRWAVARGLNKMLGHKQGGEAMKNIVETLIGIEQVKHASFFAFSTENWNRDQKEIDYIFEIAYNFIDECQDNFSDRNVRLIAIGDLSKFPQKLQDALEKAMKRTENNTGLTVNLALNYGGRDDIIQAANKVAKSGKEITVENLKENLYSHESPDIDLLVRTSGEERVSNFMLFQLAYSELYFTKTCWPDFDAKELNKALLEYSNRNRRFGGN